MSLLSLPPVPPELKSVQPFLQRAEEIKGTDPVIAYWCAYYAAQLGIALKLKDNVSRTFLLDLLGTLETMKADIGQNDAIDDESASSAYIENFAIRVFAAADNEDRRGNATRGTAKKFLAAANFLEVLTTFTQGSDAAATTINVPEKIKYAKWKAADLAKAFREGRKPTPGAPGEAEQAAEELSPPARPDSASPPAIHRSTPPPGPISDFPPSTPPIDSPFAAPPQGLVDPKDGPTSPGAWSTAATPGAQEQFPITPHTAGVSPQQSGLRRAWVSDEMEGRDDDGDEGGVASPASSEPKTVRFTPSVTGGLTPSAEPHIDGLFPTLPSPPQGVDAPAESIPGLTGFDPEIPAPPTVTTSSSPDPPVQPFVPPPVVHYPTPPPPVPSYPPVNQPAPIPPPVQATITEPPEELSPKEIARVQKHCKFAISALDYEDLTTARKELRAALTMLGG